MSQAAYEVNGQLVSPDRFYEVACDPRRSVVVEACAGAGKTWMLVSRILRALLDGVPPNQILAITFTKKAAGEMRERLHAWLRDFAHADAAQREQELRIRGVPAVRLAELAAQLPLLYARWLDEGKGVDIHTIHGWFSRLVKAAPLDVLHELGLPPELQLVEDTSEHWPELWGRFLRRVDAAAPAQRKERGQKQGGDAPLQDGPVYDDFMAVVREVGRFNAEAWLRQALSNRLELSLADQGGRLAQSVPSVDEWSPAWAGLAHPSEALARDSVRTHFWSLARQLATEKTKTQQAAGVAIEQALGLPELTQQARALCKALFTDKGEPRKKLGELADLAWAQDWLNDYQQAVRQHEAHALHAHMVTLSRLLFQEYAAFKTERGLADMVDLELAAARLLGDPVLSGWVQERLDSQVRQLLMDEFQDTSPLQWQTLKAWLAGYAGAGGGVSGQQPVSVFLVGDPKQSIYRFRRADPRVFQAAKGFVIDALGGDLLACDHTRRNAPGIIEALNLVMGQAASEGAFPGFRAHTTASTAPADVRVLPTITREAAKQQQPDAPVAGHGWRDSLTVPRERARTSIRELEAAQAAQAIVVLLDGEGLQPSDIFVLSRKRATLALVAAELDARGVPHLAPEDSLLIDTAEVRDLVAVLDAIVSPQHDLALAQALKSPLFGASDDDLLAVAAWRREAAAAGGRPGTWWASLMAMAEGHLADPVDEGSGEGRAAQAAACPPSLQRAASLLRGWADAARTAPPHDLLERIVTEGDYRARLVASVPPSRRAQALFHVDALLSQSLDMDAGRDATPYRWVRALKRMPLALPPRAQADAVQLLTIHGAKGLEAKAVFMVDTDPEPARRESYGLMVDWPESEPMPLRCAFVRSESTPPPSLAATLDAEREADQREELNALYVALTRARERLVFSRTQPRGQGAGSWWQRLVASGAIDPTQPWVPVEGDGRGHEALMRAASPRGAQGLPDAVDEVGLSCLPSPAPRALPSAPADPSPSRAAPERSVEQLLGQVVHRVLEWLTALPLADRGDERVRRAVQAAARELALPEPHQEAARHLAAAILRAPALQPWLDPAALRWAGNEVALRDGGQVLRIDRLVQIERAGQLEWWVLDYKLQHRPQALEAYRAQLARYVEAVSRLQPGEPVRAAFITGAGAFLPLE